MTNIPPDHDSKVANNRIPLAEWIVAAMGGVLVIGSFVFLAYRSVSEREPASFVFEVINVNSMEPYRAVTVAVKNVGGKPVADLLVRAIGKEAETREVTIDYVPAKSSRQVTFVFDQFTVISQLTFTIESFTEP